MKKGRAVDIERLQSDVRWALSKGLGPRDLVPMLEQLERMRPAVRTPLASAPERNSPNSSSRTSPGAHVSLLVKPT